MHYTVSRIADLPSARGTHSQALRLQTLCAACQSQPATRSCATLKARTGISSKAQHPDPECYILLGCRTSMRRWIRRPGKGSRSGGRQTGRPAAASTSRPAAASTLPARRDHRRSSRSLQAPATWQRWCRRRGRRRRQRQRRQRAADGTTNRGVEAEGASAGGGGSRHDSKGQCCGTTRCGVEAAAGTEAAVQSRW